MVGVLRAGGLPDKVIAFACDLLPLYAMAIACEESLCDCEESLFDFEGAPQADFDAFVESMRGYFADLPRERFPNVVAVAALLTEGDNNERFEFGLEVLVRGLAAMAE